MTKKNRQERKQVGRGLERQEGKEGEKEDKEKDRQTDRQKMIEIWRKESEIVTKKKRQRDWKKDRKDDRNERGGMEERKIECDSDFDYVNVRHT